MKAKLLLEASGRDRLPFGRSKKGYCELTQEISRFRARCIQGERAMSPETLWAREKNTKRLSNEQLTQQRQQVTRLSTARQANKLIATLRDGALRKIDTKSLCSPGKTMYDP